MSLKWLTTFLTICFCLALVAFAFVVRKPLCIDSRLVEKIDRVDLGGTHEVYQCAYRRHVPFDLKLSHWIPDLEKRIDDLEVWNHWQSLLRPVGLVILDGQGSFFRVHDHEIYIGDKLLTKKGFVERGLIKVWFRERADKSMIQNPLVEEMVVDLVQSIIYGSLDIEYPESKEVLSLSAVPQWPQVLLSGASYCQSPWRRAEQIENCKSEGFEILSLRPLLAKAFSSAFTKLSTEERVRAFIELQSILPNLRFQMLPITETTPLALSVAFVNSLKESWATSLETTQVLRRLFQEFGNQLRIFGFQSEFFATYLDVIIDKPELGSDDIQDLANQVESVQKSAVVFTRDNMILLPSKESFSKNSLGQLSASRMIWMKCGLPTTDEVLERGKWSQRLLVVSSCAAEKIDFSSYLEDGVESFAKANKTAGFIHIHVPSFLLSMKRKENPFEWANAEFDKSLNAYKGVSPIEAIDYFRGPHP